MSTARYPLETLERLHHLERDEQVTGLARASSHLEERRQKLAEVARGRSRLELRLRLERSKLAQRLEAEPISVRELADQAGFEGSLERQLARALERERVVTADVTDAENVHARLRDELLLGHAELQAIEKHRDRWQQRQSLVREGAREEETDEWLAARPRPPTRRPA